MNHIKLRIQQRGVAMLLLVVTLVMGAAAVFYGLTTATPPEFERDRKTAEALAIAKAALIGYAIGESNLTGGNRRLGNLPCPDRRDDGFAGGVTGTTCGNAAGNQQARRLGRLPWKTLGLPDLRDGDGERLWYAVSNNFKQSTPTTCTAPGQTGCLNSDARGTITIRQKDAAGNYVVIQDGNNPDPYTPSGVIAVIFAPGAVLTRQGSVTPQSRTCSGGFCNATGTCTTNPESNTPKCNPANYLDTVTGIEDNASFVDVGAAGTLDGFIHGPIRDSAGQIIVNDRLITITYQDLMPLLEKRVAMEILNCMRGYAVVNGGRYPWANPVAASDTNDFSNTPFGRAPGLGGSYLNNTVASGPGMAGVYSSSCAILQGSALSTWWWNNWREHVFYGIADAYKPASGAPAGCAAPGSCLSVNPPSAAANKEVVVLVAGKRLAGVASNQPRSGVADKQNPANYLEGNFTWPTFTKPSVSATFNDTVVSYPP